MLLLPDEEELELLLEELLELLLDELELLLLKISLRKLPDSFSLRVELVVFLGPLL